MKTLTLKQPWASLVAMGRKTIELRTWRVKYRGPLLIAAGVRWDDRGVEVVRRLGLERSAMPHGVAVAVVTLINITPFVRGDERCALAHPGADAARTFSWHLAFADPLRDGAYIPIRGQQGLFEIDGSTSRHIMAWLSKRDG